jgi:hypothetical protein
MINRVPLVRLELIKYLEKGELSIDAPTMFQRAAEEKALYGETELEWFVANQKRFSLEEIEIDEKGEESVSKFEGFILFPEYKKKCPITGRDLIGCARCGVSLLYQARTYFQNK